MLRYESLKIAYVGNNLEMGLDYNIYLNIIRYVSFFFTLLPLFYNQIVSISTLKENQTRISCFAIP